MLFIYMKTISGKYKSFQINTFLMLQFFLQKMIFTLSNDITRRKMDYKI